MDPLSVTLAVISLATAVKDMVELGQKIHESFAKVSSNQRKAHRIAKDIFEMVERINIFYDEHKDALDNMQNFRVALLGLLNKFKNFASSILPLLPKTNKKKLRHIIRGWWNNKIEGHLLDLQSDIIQVILEYTVNSSMRAEVKLETIHQDTSQGLMNVQKDMTQGFEVIRKDISSLRATAATTVTRYLYESSGPGTMNSKSNRNIIMFAQSTSSASTPMLRSPDVITEDVATTVYIKVQINSIATIVEKILTTSQARRASPQDSVAKFSWTPIVRETSMDMMHLRHHVVREVTCIRDLLDIERPQAISISGITALNRLSVALDILCMPHEAILVSTWTVTLARALAGASRTQREQSDLDAHLVFYLLNQSVEYSNSGNLSQSLEAITEAYSITQTLRNQDVGEAVFQILHSKVLLHHASLSDNQQSRKMCFEAIHILEDILNVQVFTQPKLCNANEKAMQPSSSVLSSLFSSTSPKVAIVEYAYALESMGAYLCVDGHLNGGLDLRLLAVEVHRKLVSSHGDEWKVKLALALLSLVGNKAADLMPAEQLLDMTEECLQLLRELAGNNPPYYARKLIKALWVKATTLQNLSRVTEAITTWEEVASLSRKIVEDSTLYAHALGQLSDQFRRLKRHDEAVRTGELAITMYHENTETQALRYVYLSRDLWQLGRYTEAVDAARASVTLHQRLEMRAPGIWVHNLIESLSELAHFLAALGHNSEALIAWRESVGMINNFLDAHIGANMDVQVIDRCCAIFTLHQVISLTLKDKEESLQVCSTAVQHLRRLLDICPQDIGITNCLFWTEYFFAYSMLRFGHPQDAHQYVNSWLGRWSTIPNTIPKSTMATQQAMLINFQVDIYNAQGRTEQAVLTTQNVHDVVKPYVDSFQPCFASMIKAMHHEARLKGSLGDTGGALRIAEAALQLARNNKLEPIINTLVRSLYRVASTALLYQNYDRAAEAAQEGYDILSSAEGLKFGRNDEYWSFMRPSLCAILSSAEANLGRFSTALDYAHRAVNMSLDMKENKLYISSTTAESSCIETRGNLAEILLAAGDFARAWQICKERSAYFSERVETRMGEYRDLAPTLRMLGILCCREGHHKEGEAAAQELTRIMRMLGSAFPSLQEQVKIRLRHQATIPILNVLNGLCQELDCGHQVDISLFEN